MSILYLTPASIGYLTQFILTSAIAGYFWYLARRSWQGETRPLPIMLLAGAFTAFAWATLLLFLNASLLPDLTFYAMPLESIAVALFLTFLLQFAYRFPSPVPDQKWEARVMLGLTILDTLWEAAFAIQRYTILAQGHVRYRPLVADFPLAVGFLWVATVFLRQTAHTSTGDPQARDTVWLRLWRPRGRPARAARALALLSVMALGFEVVDLLKGYLILPSGTTDLIQSLGILFTLSAFALVYLNYLPATTSVMVKLVGVTLAVTLAILGSVGWVVSPAYVAAYHNDRFIADKQTLRFTPNGQGGYDVDLAPFHFESVLGTDLGFDGPMRAELAFDFPFYGQVWHQVYIQANGAVSFGQALDWKDVGLRYGPLPAIFPLVVDLAPADSPPGGLFVKNTADKLLVTWSQLSAAREREARYTFQLALYPGGAFDITYNGLPASQTYAVYDLRAAPWLIGAVPGSTGLRPDPIRFTADSPYSGGRGGIVEDYYLDFRRFFHQLLLPLAYLIIGSSLLIIVCFPIFFRLNLVKPLNSLLRGVRQINIGNLEVAMPVHYHDEIGFLTQSFNDMSTELQRRTLALRRRAAELEALESVSSALRQAVTSEDMIPILVEETVNALGANAGSVLLLDGDALVVAGLHGLPPTLLARRVLPGDIPCWPALQAGQLMLFDPVGEGECATCGLCQTLAHGTPSPDPCAPDQDRLVEGRTLVVVPLQTADQVLGLLQVAFDQPDSFLKEHHRPLVAIAEMGSNALQRAQTMEMLEQLVQDRTRELTALYEVTRVTTQHLDLQVILEQVLEKALEVVGGAAGLVHLLDDAGETLHLDAQRGMPPEMIDQVQAQSPAGSLWDQVVERNETVIKTLKVSEIFRVSPEESLAYIGVPIHARGRVLGALSLIGEAGQDFSVEDIALLAGVADHVGAAVESARLRQRGQETAVQEERRRLARDLHDSVTQSLHSLVLSADTAGHLLRQNRPEVLQDSLGRLGESARQALKEMRLLLYELRLAPLEQLNLVEVLQIRLEAVEKRAGVEARLTVDGPADWPKAWESELYCIAMEALNNALRHARATQVSVRLRGGENRVELEVADNGRGFDPQRRSAAGMGLHNMAERAQRLGGELTIDSAPGAGTRVGVGLENGD